MDEEPKKRQTKHSIKQSKKGAVLLSDFFMCSLALYGLCGTAFGVASFHVETIHLYLFDAPATTMTQRLEYIGLSAAHSAVGFCYMLWRNNWHFRFATLLKIVTAWCVALATTVFVQTNEIALGCLGLILFSYALIWTFRDKERDLRKSHRELLKNTEKGN